MPSALTRRSLLLSSSAAALAAPVLRVPRETVIPAALTPFDAELRIDRPAFRRHIESLASVRGVGAIMVNGAAGQDRALSRQERRMLLAEALAAAGNRTPILAALRETSALSLADLAADAVAEQAHALLLMPPPDKKDFEFANARARLNRVFAAAPTSPLALYQTAYSNDTLTQLAALPLVFAVKEGSGDPATFEHNLRTVHGLGRGTTVWTTNSRWLLADLATGADGILSGMGSVAALLQAQLLEAMQRSDLDAARRVNDRLFPLTQAFYRPGNDPHTRMKYALRRLGQWGNDLVRPPLPALDDTERARIDAALRAGGLLRE